MQGLKVHCHAIQCFYVDFLRSKMAARRLEAVAPANESQDLAAFSFFFTCSRASRLIDVGVSVSCSCKVIPLSRTKLGFEIWSRKWKDKFAHQQWWKISRNPKQACRAPRINLDLSWFDDRSRLAIFQVQLCIFRYTVQYTLRQSTGKSLVERALLERYTAAIIFPHNKMAQKLTE